MFSSSGYRSQKSDYTVFFGWNGSFYGELLGPRKLTRFNSLSPINVSLQNSRSVSGCGLEETPMGDGYDTATCANA